MTGPLAVTFKFAILTSYSYSGTSFWNNTQKVNPRLDRPQGNYKITILSLTFPQLHPEADFYWCRLAALYVRYRALDTSLTYGIRLFISAMRTTFHLCARASRLPSSFALVWLTLLAIWGASAFNTTSNTASYNEDQSDALSPPFTPPEAVYNDSDSPNAIFGGKGIYGAGVSIACRPSDNEYLRETSDFDKLASAVASTIMTLIPALLTFTPLRTAKISSLGFLSTEAAFFTAAMTFGLFNKGMHTLARDRTLKVADLCTLQNVFFDIQAILAPKIT